MFGPFKKKKNKINEIDIDSLIEGIKLGELLLIDSRNKKLYEDSHIDSAINIPDLEFEKYTDKLPFDKLFPIVFYCKDDKCNISVNSAKKAVKLGYKNVYLFRGGIEAWNEYKNIKKKIKKQKNGLDEKTFKKFYKLNKENILLVDVSNKEDYNAGHLKGAISFPFGKLSGSYQKLITDKNIIFYCQSGTKAFEAYLFLSEKPEFNKNKLFYIDMSVTFTEDKKVIFEKN